MLLIRAWEVLDSDLDQKTNKPASVLRGFPQSVQENFKISTSIMP
jgi:hypothetical protein